MASMVFERFADRSEALAEFAHAEAGVHQDARIFGGQQRGVPGTAAGQHAEFDDTSFSLNIQNTPNHQKQNRVDLFPDLPC